MFIKTDQDEKQKIYRITLLEMGGEDNYTYNRDYFTILRLLIPINFKNWQHNTI